MMHWNTDSHGRPQQLVDGLFIGPDKAGSSWVQRYLQQHPAVQVPPAKDLFFFDRYHARGASWYTRQFPDREAGVRRVEVCHDYLFSPTAAQRTSALPEPVRLLVVLRHPLDRAISSFLYMRRQGRTKLDLDEALTSIPELLDHGRYAKHLSVWLQHHPAASVTCVDFELLSDDPARFARHVCAALGIPAWTPPDEILAKRVRPAAAARIQPIATLGRRVAVALRQARLERLVGGLKANRAIERLLFRPVTQDETPTVSAACRREIAQAMVPDAQELDRLMGSDYAVRWWGADAS